MKGLFIAIILAMGISFTIGIVTQIIRHRKKPETRYICSSCGEHDCVCHKE
jgi:hypothetical protein